MLIRGVTRLDNPDEDARNQGDFRSDGSTEEHSAAVEQNLRWLTARRRERLDEVNRRFVRAMPVLQERTAAAAARFKADSETWGRAPLPTAAATSDEHHQVDEGNGSGWREASVEDWKRPLAASRQP